MFLPSTFKSLLSAKRGDLTVGGMSWSGDLAITCAGACEVLRPANNRNRIPHKCGTTNEDEWVFLLSTFKSLLSAKREDHAITWDLAVCEVGAPEHIKWDLHTTEMIDAHRLSLVG